MVERTVFALSRVPLPMWFTPLNSNVQAQAIIAQHRLGLHADAGHGIGPPVIGVTIG